MKQCLILLLFTYCAFSLKAQVKAHKVVNDTAIYTAVEKEAEPKKGFDDFFKYLGGLKYPKLAKGQDISNYTDWTARWVVEKDGSLTYISIIRGGSKELQDQLIKLVKRYPKWKPALRNRKIVRSEFLLPMRVNLGDN
jgi:periplasmic protein TonB